MSSKMSSASSDIHSPNQTLTISSSQNLTLQSDEEDLQSNYSNFGLLDSQSIGKFFLFSASLRVSRKTVLVWQAKYVFISKSKIVSKKSISIFLSFIYVPQPSSGVSCRTWEPTRNFELHPLFNPWGLLALIPFNITRYKCWLFLNCYSPAVRIESATSRWLSLRSIGNWCL